MNYKPPREAARETSRSIAPPARPAATRARFAASSSHPDRSRARATVPRPTATRRSVGPPGHWAETLTHFALDLGFSTFMLVTPPDPQTLTRFIEDVAPDVRERVAEGRA